MAQVSTSKKIIEAAKSLGQEKGLDLDFIKEAIVESFQLAIGKKFEDEYKIDQRLLKGSKTKEVVKKKEGEVVEKLPTALVRVDCDLEKGKIEVYHQFEVLEDDDITDDFLQISLEEAKKINPRIKLHGFIEEKVDLSTLNKKDVDRFISNFKQKISKAEKDMLLEAYHDKIGQLVTGIVEKADKNSVIVNLGRTTTTLYSRDLIGDETFKINDPIKVYIKGIKKDDKKAPSISASRSCDGFLQKLFENEVNEINDGTVVIKQIARYAGTRSKVVVYSTDPNVDPSGACIGKNGERIQRIVQNLGNARDYKEKIDVILYHKNLGVYLAEILKPAQVIGVNINEEAKTAQVICTNNTMSLAIGPKGVNTSLAKKLTGLNDIKVFNDTELEKAGITYFKPIEEYIAEDEEDIKEEAKKRFREENLKSIEERQEKEVTPTKAPNFEEFYKDGDSEVEEENYIEDSVTLEPLNEVKEEVIPQEVVKEEKPIKVEEIKEVKTTTTLESLEKSLEDEKKQKEEKSKKTKKVKEEVKKEEKKEKEEKKPVVKMDIYTKEELEEFEEEDEEFEDSFDDYDDDKWADYDFDKYYED